MSIAPHTGIVDFGTFTSPTASTDGIQGEVPMPLAGQATYVLSANGWVPATSSSGTVTQVDTGTGLTGGPITTTGTVALANTAVSPGAYTNANITVDQQGRITLASNGSAGGVTSFSAGSTGLTPNTATTGAISLAGTLAVGYGGTGVTSSSGANSVVLRDANNNITANAYINGFTSVAASGSTITLTVASTPVYLVTGSGGQVIQLPNATTLSNGTIFSFNNNQSSGAITVNNNSGTLVVSIPSGAYVTVTLLDNTTAAGSWDRHDQTPSNVSWSTNTFDYPGSITSATWNGNVVAYNRGGTGQSAAFVAGGIVYGSTTSVLAVTAVGTSGQVLTSAGAGTPTWTTPTTGTVTSVGGTGTVNGISLSGTVTSSGNLTLGGTLDLSSPPAIGGTTPAAGKFTTLESTGTASLATGSTTSIQIVGDASYPQVKATGGTNTPLVLTPLGTGALQAQKTDSAATGGNARGANAVDWQTLRSTAAQVVSGGAGSTIGGGQSNTVSAGSSTVAGGQFNLVSGFASTIAGGNSNTATLNYTFIGGGAINTAAGYYNVIGGGFTNSGTASAAVTTQSATMNGTTAVTLSGSNASIKVGQFISGTSISNNTYVAAISGTALTLSQVASGSSTSTLSFFTPHGIVVGGGNNQATGSYSFIGGGGDGGTSTNRNVASGDWSFIGGGYKQTASGTRSFIGGGDSHTASSTATVVCGGAGNNALGFGSSIVGGNGNRSDGTYSFVAGGASGTTRSIAGYHTFSACSSPISSTLGITQTALLVLGRETTDATATVITSNASAASATNQIALPNNSAYAFKAMVIAGVTGAGNTSAWKLEGSIKRGANAASTVIVGTVTATRLAYDAGASTWAVTATADTTNGALAFTVTGQAATTIRWVCKVETTEMTY